MWIGAAFAQAPAAPAQQAPAPDSSPPDPTVQLLSAGPAVAARRQEAAHPELARWAERLRVVAGVSDPDLPRAVVDRAVDAYQQALTRYRAGEKDAATRAQGLLRAQVLLAERTLARARAERKRRGAQRAAIEAEAAVRAARRGEHTQRELWEGEPQSARCLSGAPQDATSQDADTPPDRSPGRVNP